LISLNIFTTSGVINGFPEESEPEPSLMYSALFYIRYQVLCVSKLPVNFATATTVLVAQEKTKTIAMQQITLSVFLWIHFFLPFRIIENLLQNYCPIQNIYRIDKKFLIKFGRVHKSTKTSTGY
jgi:hypothetical protein